MTQLPNHLVNKWQTAKRGGGIAALLRFGYIYIYIYIYVFFVWGKGIGKLAWDMQCMGLFMYGGLNVWDES